MNSPARKPSLLALTLLCALATTSHAQGTFQNLDFEMATVSQNQSPGFVSVTAGFPSWNVFIGGSQASQVLFNDATLGSTSVSLIGTTGAGSTVPLQGGYSALLQGYANSPGASISQTAVVPQNVQSIMFEAKPDPVPGTLLLSLGGQNIAISLLQTASGYNVYGGDIPAGFAGQLEQLQFLAPVSSSGPNDWEIDSIIFSPNLVPEPQTWSLLLFSAAALALKRRQPKT